MLHLANLLSVSSEVFVGYGVTTLLMQRGNFIIPYFWYFLLAAILFVASIWTYSSISSFSKAPSNIIFATMFNFFHVILLLAILLMQVGLLNFVGYSPTTNPEMPPNPPALVIPHFFDQTNSINSVHVNYKVTTSDSIIIFASASAVFIFCIILGGQTGMPGRMNSKMLLSIRLVSFMAVILPLLVNMSIFAVLGSVGGAILVLAIFEEYAQE